MNKLFSPAELASQVLWTEKHIRLEMALKSKLIIGVYLGDTATSPLIFFGQSN